MDRHAKHALYRAVIAAYTSTRTPLRELGKQFGITGARVLQIAQEGLGPDHRSRRPQEAQPGPEQVLEAVRQGGTRGLKAAWRRVWSELPADMRREARLAYIRSHRPYRKPGSSMDDLVRCLQAAALLVESGLSPTSYDKVARVQGWPRAQTIILAFGHWNTAKRAARLPVRPREGCFKAFSPEACLQAIAEVRARLGHAPSIGEYTRLRAPGAPCVSTVKRTLLHLTHGARSAADWHDVISCLPVSPPATPSTPPPDDTAAQPDAA
ncbi:MAG: hypothetical protein ACKOCB_03130 [Planctomycetia bacterium]